MSSKLILYVLLSASAPVVSGADQPKVYVGPTPAQAAPVAAATQAAPASVAPAVTPAPPPSAPANLSASELEKLAMPIALHPDPLISIILPASVYPLEIVQAARFVKDTNNIPKVDEQPWDDNVKAVAKFPELVAKMDADLPWTMKLGQAFVDQPKELMDTIQALRGKAEKAGTLRSTPQQVVTVTNVIVLQTNYTEVVTVTNTIVQVAPSNPQVVYVPSYPPTVYYPPPTYVYDPVAPLVTFGFGMAMGAIIANNCDWHGGCVWHGGDVDIDIDRNVNRNVNRDTTRAQSANRASSTSARAGQQKWQPDQNRMRTSGAPSTSTREARGWGGRSTTGGRGPSASTGMTGSRPSTGSVGARPSTGTGGARPSTGSSSFTRASTSANTGRERPSSGSARQASPSSYSRSSGGGSAFSGMSSGSSSRNFSSRGASSRGGGSGGGRGGGGRR